MSLGRTQRTIWGIALALLAAASCNLVLDNEKRTLSPSAIEGYDAGPAVVVVVDSGASSKGDASSDAGACGDVEFPECTPGEVQPGMESCGECGAGTRTRQRGCTFDCRWASWSPWSECQEPAGICKPGRTEENTEACGYCGLGMRKTTRSCTSSCGWSDWTPQACIEDESNCSPGMVMRLPDKACGTMCGQASQTRTCNSSCQWDPIVTGECVSHAECAPGATRMVDAVGCNPAYCNKGIQQRIQLCTDSCTWAPPAPTGGCTFPEGVCRPMDLGGMGFRCKPNDRGFRETCTPSTAAPAEACMWRGRQADSSCGG